jgi:hypothetical protein
VDSDTFHNRDDEAGVCTWEARFTSTATDATDELKVTIYGYDQAQHDFGPVVWQPHDGPAYPQAGDLALVAQSDTGRWWVLQWIES